MARQVDPKHHSYRIENPVDEPRLLGATEFEALDAAIALFKVRKLLPNGGSVIMFEDGRALGRMELDTSGFWTVAANRARTRRSSN